MKKADEMSDFEEFLENQKKPPKPTPKEIEWAEDRFSSRVTPPKP